MNRLNNQVARLDKYRAALADSNFRASARVSNNVAEISLHGYVGDAWEQMDSGSIAGFLAENRDREVHVSINSPGGLAFDGIAIANALSEHPKRTTGTIEGLAGSAASIIATGVDHLRIRENAVFMMHRSQAVSVGNQFDHADVIQAQERIDEALIATYVARSSATREKIVELIDGNANDGTYLSANEALELGLVDEIVPMATKNASQTIENIGSLGEKGDATIAHLADLATGNGEEIAPFAKKNEESVDENLDRVKKQKIAAAVKVRAARVAIDLTE